MSDFPKLTLKGGPHGARVELRVDGKQTNKVHRVELVVDVNDAIRAKVFQFVEIAEIEVEGVLEKVGEVKATIGLRRPDEDPDVIPFRLLGSYEGTGKNLREAVLAALEQVP